MGPPDLVGTSGLHAYEERARSRSTRLDWTGSRVVSVCREDARDSLKLLACKYERFLWREKALKFQVRSFSLLAREYEREFFR